MEKCDSHIAVTGQSKPNCCGPAPAHLATIFMSMTNGLKLLVRRRQELEERTMLDYICIRTVTSDIGQSCRIGS